jgi:hypothetical protein
MCVERAVVKMTYQEIDAYKQQQIRGCERLACLDTFEEAMSYIPSKDKEEIADKLIKVLIDSGYVDIVHSCLPEDEPEDYIDDDHLPVELAGEYQALRLLA